MMNDNAHEQALRPANVAAAAVLIGGVLVIALPHHGTSILRLVIVTAAAAAAIYTVVLHVPPAWWLSPFDPRFHRSTRGDAPDDVAWIRSTLCGRRQRIANGPPLPPEALRLLQPLIRSALERDGSAAVAAAERLAPVTRAVLAAEPLVHPPRHRTVRPDAKQSAAAVQRVLDDLDRLVRAGARPREIANPEPRVP